MRISKQQREENTKKCRALIADNNFDAFKQLLPESSVNANGASLMVTAILANQPRFVEAMLPTFSATTHARHCVYKAIVHRHYDCLKRLSSVAPQSVISDRLINAMLEHNVECAKAMLPYYDPKADEGAVLAAAVCVGNAEFIEYLFPISPVEIALEYKTRPGGARLLELIAQDNLKHKMLNEIQISKPAPSKKL